MTTDVIALTERMPDSWSLVAGLMSGGPDTQIGLTGDGAVIQLSDDEGRPLVYVEAPFLVHSPAEVARLLDVEVPGPVWWTEIRAATAAPQAQALASTMATRFVLLLGGTVWPLSAAAPDGGAAPVPAFGALAARAAVQPAVDVLTDKAAAVIQDRPVVALTAWLSDALRATAASDRGLQLVTPGTSRLSLPLRTALSGQPNRWVVKDGSGGYHDGLSGAELVWKDGAFVSTGRMADGFAQATGQAEGTPERQLLVSFTTRSPATLDLLLGGGVEAAWRILCAGAEPAGWGTAEPANLPWSRDEPTVLARRRAPDPTWLVVVGGAAVATLRVGVTKGGIEEDVTLAIGFPEGDEPPFHAVADLADELVRGHGLVSMFVQLRGARADLTVPPYLEEAPRPYAFVLGAEGVREIGRDNAMHAPLPDRPMLIGSTAERALYYPLAEAGWEGFQELMGYLHNLDPSRLDPARMERARAAEARRPPEGTEGADAPGP